MMSTRWKRDREIQGQADRHRTVPVYISWLKIIFKGGWKLLQRVGHQSWYSLFKTLSISHMRHLC